jgi:hypothetical protein
MSSTGLAARSSSRLAEGQRGGAPALEPGYTSAGGQVHQGIAAANRRLEPEGHRRNRRKTPTSSAGSQHTVCVWKGIFCRRRKSGCLGLLSSGSTSQAERIACYACIEIGLSRLGYRPSGHNEGIVQDSEDEGAETSGKIRLGVAVSLNGSQAWKDWLWRFAHHSRLDVAKLIDKALIHYAASEGFSEPSPRR